MTENNKIELCHYCRCEAHCDERICGDCKECTECGCWHCQSQRNPVNHDADLLS